MNSEFFNPETPLTDSRLDSLGIIMDGNGRWAERRGLPRELGHAEGAVALRRVLGILHEIGIHYVTLYAFSTENWKRPKSEVNGLWELIYKNLDDLLKTRGKSPAFSMKFIGDRSALPEKLINKCIEIEKSTSGSDFVCNVALNYGGRAEIVDAVNRAVKNGHTRFTEELLSSYMQTYKTPDPDLIIRTGGEFRISNFLLWQSAYSEYVILDRLWPDMDREDILFAIKQFYSRSRRFGGLDTEEKRGKKN